MFASAGLPRSFHAASIRVDFPRFGELTSDGGCRKHFSENSKALPRTLVFRPLPRKLARSFRAAGFDFREVIVLNTWGFWSLLSLKSPCLLIGGCKSRGGPCPIVHFLASFFITDLVFKRRASFLSFQVFNSGLPFLFQGEPSLFCTSFRATESKCGQMEAAACCSNQVLNPHACLLYITISHFSLEYTIIYISQMASYARFINFAPTEEPSVH